jgi:hypothetical protein
VDRWLRKTLLRQPETYPTFQPGTFQNKNPENYCWINLLNCVRLCFHRWIQPQRHNFGTIFIQYLLFCTILYFRIYFREQRDRPKHKCRDKLMKYSTTILHTPESQTFQPWDKVIRNSFPYYSTNTSLALEHLHPYVSSVQFATAQRTTIPLHCIHIIISLVWRHTVQFFCCSK